MAKRGLTRKRGALLNCKPIHPPTYWTQHDGLDLFGSCPAGSSAYTGASHHKDLGISRSPAPWGGRESMRDKARDASSSDGENEGNGPGKAPRRHTASPFIRVLRCLDSFSSQRSGNPAACRVNRAYGDHFPARCVHSLAAASTLPDSNGKGGPVCSPSTAKSASVRRQG